MSTSILWHNPRCSKSRQALRLLEEKAVGVKIVTYLEAPPTAKQISEVLDLLGLEPRDLMRKKEAPYRDLNLDDPAKSREELPSKNMNMF
ncbi:MAG: ArsC/Spx/MgsR family protein [bacterium]